MFTDSQPRHTRIEKVISVPSGKAILEDHNKYPANEANLYFIANNGDPVWEAERPAPNAHYIRVKLSEDGRILSAYTTTLHACEIDIKSGKLLQHVLTHVVQDESAAIQPLSLLH